MREVDRTPKSCQHKRANHVHGTRACYVLDRCRCLPCSKANADAENARVRAKAYGRYNKYVDAEPVRAHVRALMDAGIGLKQIVRLGAASQGTLWKLVYGKTRPDGSRTPSRRVLRTTAERLYALTPNTDHLAGGANIPAHGTRRRLQALVALGWSQRKLADRLGWGAANFGTMLHHRGQVTKDTADKVKALYDELSMKPPVPVDKYDLIGINRAKNRAAYFMWLPPLAWDDDDIDDPFAQPEVGFEVARTRAEVDEVAVQRFIDGDLPLSTLTTADRREVVARWQAMGRPLNELDRRGLNSRRYIEAAA